MSNELEVEDKIADETMSEAEIVETKKEMMRYRANSLSYWLGFGAIGFSVLASFVCLNSFAPTTVLVILKILLNIIILLFGFLSCEKTKAYSEKSSIALIGIGGVCVLRIFWVPLQLLIYFNKFVPAQETLAKDATNKEASAIVAECRNYLGTTITDYYRGDKLSIHWLPANGNFRGILAMVLLACAAAMFIAAGVIGLIRSKKLSSYMSSLNQKN